MPKIALLDAGAQQEKVIIRRVLECGYEIDKFRADVHPSHLKDYDAIIISGGPRSVYEKDALLPHPDIYKLGKPILGICYGIQAIAHQLGGRVIPGEKGQYGRNFINISEKGPLFHRLSSRERVLMSHFDIVQKTPEGFDTYATSEGTIATIGNKEKRIYAVQFHPELIPITKKGNEIFENFFWNICNFPEAEKRPIEKEIENAQRIIQETAGSDKVVMHYLSGGVDSTVMAILLSQSIEPDRLYMRTLDTGTMRLGEIEQVKTMAKELEFPNFQVLDVKDKFYDSIRRIKTRSNDMILAGPLCYTIEPECKRKIFSAEYQAIARTEMAHIAYEIGISIEDMLLGQGTLRPDLIESGDERVTKGKAHTIKTHHNADMDDVSTVEPLVELFKDQVRQVALKLGLPEKFAYRPPFPGPGLYCRIIGSYGFNVDENYSDLEKRVQQAGKRKGFNVHFLPVRTVGVQGDERSYKHPVIVSGEVDWKEFAQLALDLPNEIKDINRVLYSPGEPITKSQARSLTKTLMTSDVIEQAQRFDHDMRMVAEEFGYNDSRKCSQMPGILIPSNFGKKGKRSFVIRPTWTHDFMAIIGMMPYKEKPIIDPEEFFPEDMLNEMTLELMDNPDISRVILDATDKPPASTEWE